MIGQVPLWPAASSTEVDKDKQGHLEQAEDPQARGSDSNDDSLCRHHKNGGLPCRCKGLPGGIFKQEAIVQRADPSTNQEGVREKDHENHIRFVERDVGGKEDHKLGLHQGAGEGVAQVAETIDVAKVQPAKHGKERGKSLSDAHSDVQVPAIGDPCRARFLWHVRPCLYKSPPLLRRGRHIISKHQPHCIDRFLDITPDSDFQGQVSEKEAKDDAGEALNRKGRVQWAARAEQLKVVETCLWNAGEVRPLTELAAHPK